MRDSGRAGQQPTVLIASHQEAFSRSLESILVPHGIHVVRAYTAAQTLARARAAQPHVIIVDTLLPDRAGLDMSRELRREPLLSFTPIVVVSPDPVSRQERIAALKAGAWDLLGAPFDAEQLRLKVETFARAKLENDRAWEEGLLDRRTGLYNLRGLARRAQELAAQAWRQSVPFACVVFAPEFGGPGGGFDPPDPPDEAIGAAVDRLAAALTMAARRGDAIGRVGPTEFAVVALGTDAIGAVKLGERLRQAVLAHQDKSGSTTALFRLRAGYYAVADPHRQPADAAATVLRAAAAMRQSSGQGDHWIHAFPADLTEGPRPSP